LRVVWGLGEVIAIFCPTMRFSNVDLPTFGRPMIATNPERNVGFSVTQPSAGRQFVNAEILAKDAQESPLNVLV